MVNDMWKIGNRVLLHLPLKQGLKLTTRDFIIGASQCSFTSSIKTRIET